MRYSGKVERELSMGERQQQQQQQQQQQDDADDDVDSGATRVVRARQAFAANRSSSLPIRNFGDSQRTSLSRSVTIQSLLDFHSVDSFQLEWACAFFFFFFEFFFFFFEFFIV